MPPIVLSPEYSTVRGQDGFTPEIHTGRAFAQAFEDEYWGAGWGLAKKLIGSVTFLLPALFFGRLGQGLAVRLFENCFRNLSVHRTGQILQTLCSELGDEIGSALFTGSVRVFWSGDEWTGYFKDLGQGGISRAVVRVGLGGRSPDSLLVRFVALPFLMTVGGWWGEIAVERDRHFHELFNCDKLWELAYRGLSTYAMIGQSTGILRGLPYLLGKGGLHCPSFHPDDWLSGPSPSTADFTRVERKPREGNFVSDVSLDLAVRQILQLPSCTYGGMATTIPWQNEPARRVEALVSDNLDYPRLKALFRLLCGATDPARLTVVENGAGSHFDLATVCAKLGSRVIEKELHILADLEAHFRNFAGVALASRVTYVRNLSQETPGTVVFWSNPDIVQNVPVGMSLVQYLGRDAERWLVIQTDHPKRLSGEDPGHRDLLDRRYHLRNLSFDPDQWDTIFRGFLPPEDGFYSSFVIPTKFTGGTEIYLQIYRRRTRGSPC